MKQWRIIVFSIFGLILISFLTYFFILVAGNAMIDEKKLVLDSSSKLVDPSGKEITELYQKNRELVSINKIPKNVQNAFIAVEDQRFYEHHGIDVRSIARALFKDLIAGSKVEGGSTITQQIAKNVFLSGEKSVMRKTKEAVIAVSLENNYSKKRLLEIYLNQLYFGHGAYGIQAASHYFFSKDVTELTPSEAATLASLPKAPSGYSPILHPEKSKKRRDLVLSLMQEQGFISSEEAVRAQGKTLGLKINKKAESPWFASYIDLVLNEAEEKYNISNDELLRGGYTITVPLNADLQKKAYQLFKEDSYFKGTVSGSQASFIMLDNKTGGAVAAIGGRDYVSKGYNRVTKSRQPGSTFKPLAVYGPALQENKFQPFSMLKDEPIKYGNYAPKNPEGYSGETTMYNALIHSLNAPAVWTLNEIGISKAKKYLEETGVPVDDNGLAIALGGLEKGVSPLNLANAYRTFADNGQYSDAYFIEKITDRHNNITAERKEEKKPVYSPQNALYMTRMLEHVVTEGTAHYGTYGGDLAGKTGTTSYPGKKGAVMDAWFAGYTPEVTGALWMGYDRTDQSHYLTQGSSAPVRLFKAILRGSKYDNSKKFEVPSGIEDLEDPIKLQPVQNLTADYKFKGFQLFTLHLEWTAQQDSRIEYRIYEQRGNEEKVIGTVKGENTFEMPYSNIFSRRAYKVVPFNTQTGQEGPGTDYVSP
ncbi:PBP1A family penicillin-binding protein [Metabacillus sp. GX 13764]|uniref:transglycosylase domain-containing protein n=1 Tax=Metabacillus kandeliae TaxID=2900151 RepID=UPI001E4B2CE3|nr:PBP1A family penicillin-binding protein [Metabacillus kandeliae]MCD7034867.1 PBP1A family penicillin-binding protein [Metabacillus kandeliae]